MTARIRTAAIAALWRSRLSPCAVSRACLPVGRAGLYVAPDSVGSHDWAEFYTPQTGWLNADVSFGSSARRMGEEWRRRHYFGNLDPWRMVANNRFQAEFEPSFDGMREDPYDNQMGEASVDGRGCRQREMLRTVELIEMLEVPFSD